MKTKVFKYIEKHKMLQDNDTVIIGVSGGQDSICLLFLLQEYRKQIDFDIEVVHVNHGIRDTAKRDEDFVEKVCSELGITFHLFKYDVEKIAADNGISTEEAGRNVRYEAFNSVLGKRKGKIAIAHNANDNAETVLFNLFRGTGIKGLTGIAAVNGNIIRPLLETGRDEIEEFIAENGLSYVTDETNLLNTYTRNKIRHNILEYAENNIVKGTIFNILRASDQLLEINDFIEMSAKCSYENCIIERSDEAFIFSAEKLKNENSYIAKKIIYDALSDVAKTKKDITEEHVDNIIDLLYKTGTKKLSLPYSLTVTKEYDKLIIGRKKFQENNEDTLSEISIKKRLITDFKPSDIPSDTYTKWFDYDKITSTCELRYRRSGDYLCVDSKGSKQSIKEYMINNKIPKQERDSIPLLADGQHIIWIIGYRISDYYKVNSNTKKVLEVSIKN